MTAQSVRRIVAVGASNLTRGFHTIVGDGAERLGAGRRGARRPRPRTLVRRAEHVSGAGPARNPRVRPVARTRVPIRPRRTRALVTDVGNDIMYGYPPAQHPRVGRRVRRAPPAVHAGRGGHGPAPCGGRRPAGLALPAVPVGVLSALPADPRPDDARRRGRRCRAPGDSRESWRLVPEAEAGVVRRRSDPHPAGDVERRLAGDPLRRAPGRHPRAGDAEGGGPPLLHAARAGDVPGPRAAHAPARRGAAGRRRGCGSTDAAPRRDPPSGLRRLRGRPRGGPARP